MPILPLLLQERKGQVEGEGKERGKDETRGVRWVSPVQQSAFLSLRKEDKDGKEWQANQLSAFAFVSEELPMIRMPLVCANVTTDTAAAADELKAESETKVRWVLRRLGALSVVRQNDSSGAGNEAQEGTCTIVHRHIVPRLLEMPLSILAAPGTNYAAHAEQTRTVADYARFVAAHSGWAKDHTKQVSPTSAYVGASLRARGRCGATAACLHTVQPPNQAPR